MSDTFDDAVKIANNCPKLFYFTYIFDEWDANKYCEWPTECSEWTTELYIQSRDQDNTCKTLPVAYQDWIQALRLCRSAPVVSIRVDPETNHNFDLTGCRTSIRAYFGDQECRDSEIHGTKRKVLTF